MKKLDYSASSKVLRDRSTELLVSLFVKEIVSRGEVVPAGGIPSMGSLSTAAEGGDGAGENAEHCVIEEIAPEVGEDAGFLNCNIDDVAVDRSQERSDKSMWGITQALDLIDSAWGFASLDEDDEFLPRSTRTTSRFHPQTSALAAFTTTRSSAISACPSASLSTTGPHRRRRRR